MARRETHQVWRSSLLRIGVPALASFALMSGAVFLFFIPALEKNMMDGKRAMIRELSAAVWTTVALNHEEERKGLMTREEAQARSINRLRALRYGPEMKDYFWINDLHPRMVLHPYRPELEGKDLADYTDPHGKHLFVEAVKQARRPEGGYVDYMWQWKDDPGQVVPKISYVRLFEPWGWVIGTGVYVEDVRAEVAAMNRTFMLTCLGILAFTVLLALHIIWQSARDDRRRMQAADSLRYERDFSRSIIDTAQSIVFLRDRDGRIRSTNRFLEDLTGYTAAELEGRDWFDLVVPEAEREAARQAFHASVEGEPARGQTWPIVTKAGDERLIEWHDSHLRDGKGGMIALLSIGYDVTDRRRAEEEKRQLQEQLHQAQKMEAIGQLAGGVAHDFNNLLTVVLGNTELIADGLPPGSSAHGALETIEEATRQAAGVTRSLLTFSRKVSAEKQIVDINAIVAQAMKILRRMLPSTIHQDVQLASDAALWINADSTQIQQVILNLAINARDAMPEGGTLRVTTSLARPSEIERLPEGLRPDADCVCLTISDTGTGMRPDVQARIFEPFFTTKPRELGTGLGLSITHGIVGEHGGHILVESEVGRGTVFTILLPIVRPSELPAPRRRPTAVPKGRGETVLLAEDHKFIREIIASGLILYGYRPVPFSDGLALMEYYHAHPDEPGLLVLDIDLPGRSGLKCLDELRSGGCRIPVVLITGSMEVDVHSQLDDRTFVLRKPFQMAELGELMAQILSGTLSEGVVS